MKANLADAFFWFGVASYIGIILYLLFIGLPRIRERVKELEGWANQIDQDIQRVGKRIGNHFDWHNSTTPPEPARRPRPVRHRFGDQSLQQAQAHQYGWDTAVSTAYDPHAQATATQAPVTIPPPAVPSPPPAPEPDASHWVHPYE